MDINVKVTLEAPSILEGIAALLSGATTRKVAPAPAPMQATITQPTITFAPPTAAVVPVPAAYTPAAPVAQVPVPMPVPVVQAPTYNMDTLATAAAGLVQAGRQQELVALLAQFGVQALTHLKPDQYGAFATALRQIGGKI